MASPEATPPNNSLGIIRPPPSEQRPAGEGRGIFFIIHNARQNNLHIKTLPAKRLGKSTPPLALASSNVMIFLGYFSNHFDLSLCGE